MLFPLVVSLSVLTLAPAQALQQLACVRKLRHHLRVGIRGRLDAREADRREALDERALRPGGHERRLVLQPVARETLAEDRSHNVDSVNNRV